MSPRRVFKIIRRTVIGLLAAAILLFVVVWIRIDSLAATAVTKGVEHVGETSCTLDDVSVSLLRGRVGMTGLAIANPPRYPQTAMFSLDTAAVDVAVTSVIRGPVRIKELEIIQPLVRIEAGAGGSNVKVFLDAVERNTASAKPEKAPEAEPMRLIVDKLLIRDAKVVFGSGFSTLGVPVTLATVELEDIKGRDGRGVTSGELTALIITEMVKRGAVRVDLNLDRLVPTELLNRVGDIAGSLGDVGADAAKALEGTVRGVFDNIRGDKEDE